MNKFRFAITRKQDVQQLNSLLISVASWNIKGTHVIVLKQQVTSHAKWIFDLLNELYHALVHLKNEGDVIIEPNKISPISKEEDPKELEANATTTIDASVKAHSPNLNH